MAYLAPGTLEAFGLYMVRTSVLVLGSPLLGQSVSFDGYKVALVFLLSLLLYGLTGTPLEPEIDTVSYALLALREVLIGATFAYLTHLATMALDVGGHMIGHEMGLNMSNLVDPVTGASKPLISNVYQILFILALLAVDGHHWLLRALKESFLRAPVGELSFDSGVVDTLLAFLTQTFSAGLTFAAPILVLLTLVSVLIALLTRAVPQLNMMEFGFNLRVTGGIVAMLLFTPMLTPGMHRILDLLMDGLSAGLDALES